MGPLILDDAGRASCEWLVDRVFELVTAWAAELHAYALEELAPAA
jgi:hypothetical protein